MMAWSLRACWLAMGPRSNMPQATHNEMGNEVESAAEGKTLHEVTCRMRRPHRPPSTGAASPKCNCVGRRATVLLSGR